METAHDQAGVEDPPPVNPNAQPTAAIDYKALAAALREQGWQPPQQGERPAQPQQGSGDRSDRPSPPPPPRQDQPGRVSIDKARLDRLTEIESRVNAAEEAEKRKSEELALKRGEYETVLKAREAEAKEAKAKLESEEKRFRIATRDRELATALAGKPLIPGGAEQLLKLWRDEFDAHPDGEGYRVLNREYQPISEVVATRLGSAEYAHFILPTSRGGGANTAGAQRTTETPPANAGAKPEQPVNLGVAIIDVFNKRRAAQAGAYAPIGFHPRHN